MGTLYNQPPRQDKIECYVRNVVQTAEYIWPKVDNFTPDQIIAASAALTAATKLQNADVFDEQLADFGTLFRMCAESIGEFVSLSKKRANDAKDVQKDLVCSAQDAVDHLGKFVSLMETRGENDSKTTDMASVLRDIAEFRASGKTGGWDE